MNNILITISFIFLISFCKETRTLYIASHTKDCQGVAPQKCLLVKENLNDEWTYFYDQIEGFTYEEGYNYKIEVSIENIENPPADGSSLKYSLLKVISKEKNASLTQNITAIQEEDITIEYHASSRGYFFAAEIDKDSILKFEDRNLSKAKSINCPDEDWKTIISLLEKLDIKKISNLKAPSDKRTFDGAAHAQLKITLGNKTYTSISFDHGNPPKELKPLVNTILSLIESIE